MKLEDFNAFVHEKQNLCTSVLEKKAVEYGSETDILDSFKRPGILTGNAPDAVWLGFWSKGIISLFNHISAKEPVPDELIIDSINYLYLLYALLKTNGKPCDFKSFEGFVKDAFAHCEDVLVTKGSRYCKTGEDRLSSFKIAAEIEFTTPEDVLGSYMVKHTDSIIRLIRNGTDKNDPIWIEKIGDHINYLFLLWALENDSYQEKKPEISESEMLAL